MRKVPMTLCLAAMVAFAAIQVILRTTNAPSVDTTQAVDSQPGHSDCPEDTYQLGGEDSGASGHSERSPGQEGSSEAARVETPTPKVGCQCDQCTCPSKLVCKNGDCKNSYAVVYTAKWCRACPRMYPVVQQLRAEGYVVYVLDIDENPNSSVSILPTTVIMNKGMEVKRFRGITSKPAIAAMLQRQ